jgi:hypothetical protein
MLLTFFSLLLSAGLVFYSRYYPIDFNPSFLATLMIVAGTAVLMIISLTNVLFLIPLQDAEQRLVPRLGDLFRKDRRLYWANLFLFLFPFISYILAVVLLLIHIPNKLDFMAVWIVALGFSLDLIRDYTTRLAHFLTPSYTVDLITHEAKRAIQTDQDQALWEKIDNLTEVSVRAIEKSKVSLAFHALNAFPIIMHAFFASRKSIGHIAQDQAVEQQTGLDEASYASFYALQRLELIHDKALQHKLEMVAAHIITVLGKIIVYSAQYDMSMATFPARYLGKFAIKGQQQDFYEEAEMATSTLLEVSRTIIADIDLNYSEIQELFQAIITGLSSIAKMTFKKDKTVNIRLISQPLRDLKALFQSDKMANQRDTPAVIRDIDNALAEFEALEQVMRTIPPFTTPEETSGTSITISTIEEPPKGPEETER